MILPDRQRSRFAIALACAFVASWSGFGNADAQDGKAWKADPNFVKELDEAVKVRNYRFQPPKGYKRTVPAQSFPQNMKVAVWLGPVHADQTKPVISLIIAVPDAGKPIGDSLESLAKSSIGGMKTTLKDHKAGKFEPGTIDGVPFLRFRWTGISPETNKTVEGITYIAIDGENFIQLTTSDGIDHVKTTAKVHDASALSFRFPS